MATAVRQAPNLRAIREARGLSLREFSRRIGVDPSLTSKIELGYISSWPRFRDAAASELRVDVALLFGENP